MVVAAQFTGKETLARIAAKKRQREVQQQGIVPATVSSKTTLDRINENRVKRGAKPLPGGSEPEGSEVQNLYGEYMEGIGELYSALGKASGIRARGKFEEGAFIENARRLNRASDRAIESGNKTAQNFMKRIRKFAAVQKVSLAAQGIETESGSAQELQLETLEIGFEDVSTIRTNAIRTAFGHKSKALEQETEAQLSRIERKLGSRVARLGGTIRAVRKLKSPQKAKDLTG